MLMICIFTKMVIISTQENHQLETMQHVRSLELKRLSLIILCALFLQACSRYDPVRYKEMSDYENELHDKSND